MKKRVTAASECIYMIIALCLLCAVSCSNRGAEEISRGVELYVTGQLPEAVRLIEKGMIRSSAVRRFSSPYPRPENEGLIVRERSSITMVYPEKVSFTIPGETGIFAYNAGKELLAVFTGSDISILDKKGRTQREIAIPSLPKTGIKAIAWQDAKLLYYAGNRLYTCTSVAGSLPVPLMDTTFPPPSPDAYYRAALTAAPDYIVLTAGMAGQYNMSIIDAVHASVVVKNIPVSSPRFSLHADTIGFITGSAGQWKLVSLALNNRARKEITSFSSLADIELFPEGAVFEGKGGFRVYDYYAGHCMLSFNYKLLGKCGPYMYLEYGGHAYLLEAEKFFQKLKMVSAGLPAVFRKNN